MQLRYHQRSGRTSNITAALKNRPPLLFFFGPLPGCVPVYCVIMEGSELHFVLEIEHNVFI